MSYLQLAADFVYVYTSVHLDTWLPWFQHCDYMLCILAIWSLSMI